MHEEDHDQVSKQDLKHAHEALEELIVLVLKCDISEKVRAELEKVESHHYKTLIELVDHVHKQSEEKKVAAVNLDKKLKRYMTYSHHLKPHLKLEETINFENSDTGIYAIARTSDGSIFVSG